MKTVNNETMRAVDRLLDYMKQHNLSKTEVEQRLGLGKGYLYKQISRDGSLGTDLAAKIQKEYPDIDLLWLITGKGIGDNNNIQTGIVGNRLGDNSQIQYGLCQKEVENLKKIIEEKDKQNDILKEHIASLKDVIADQKEMIAMFRSNA